jgi:hypothetical protein
MSALTKHEVKLRETAADIEALEIAVKNYAAQLLAGSMTLDFVAIRELKDRLEESNTLLARARKKHQRLIEERDFR